MDNGFMSNEGHSDRRSSHSLVAGRGRRSYQSKYGESSGGTGWAEERSDWAPDQHLTPRELVPHEDKWRLQATIMEAVLERVIRRRADQVELVAAQQEIARLQTELSKQKAKGEVSTTWIPVAGTHMPGALRDVADRIEASRSILALEEDWDEDSSPAYDECTWEHAACFIAQCATTLWQKQDIVVVAPSIAPGPDASIDVLWRVEHRTLALNFPAAPKGVVTFFGRHNAVEGEFIRGEIPAEADGSWLLVWLTQ